MSKPTVEVRLECLRLAVQSSPTNHKEALGRAEEFVAFVHQSAEVIPLPTKGKSDAEPQF